MYSTQFSHFSLYYLYRLRAFFQSVVAVELWHCTQAWHSRKGDLHICHQIKQPWLYPTWSFFFSLLAPSPLLHKLGYAVWSNTILFILQWCTPHWELERCVGGISSRTVAYVKEATTFRDVTYFERLFPLADIFIAFSCLCIILRKQIGFFLLTLDLL